MRPLACRPLTTSFRISCARQTLHSRITIRSLQSSSVLLSQNKNTFADTLLLPKTSFPLWADPAQREEPYRNKTTEELYRWQVSDFLDICAIKFLCCDQWKNREDRPTFILHDGPPYANGSLHCGEFLIKQQCL